MQIKIDNSYFYAEKGEFILTVARRNGVEIPSICHNEGLPGLGSCRLCIVEVIDRGKSNIVTSCIYPINKEIHVITNSEKIIHIRKNIIRLLLTRANGNKYILSLAEKYGVKNCSGDQSAVNDDCILCGLCVKACNELGISAISTVSRGVTKKISTPYDEPSKVCIGCGTCAEVCPTKAINVEENNNNRVIWNKEFELVKCTICESPFTTKEEFEYINKKIDIENHEVVCKECKKKKAAEEFKNIFSSFSVSV